MKRLYLSLCYFLISFTLLAGNDTISNVDHFVNNKDSSGIAHRRITTLAIAGGAVYTGTMIGLYHFKYGDKLQSRFQINTVKNDWRMEMDGTHHILAGYYIGRLGFDVLRCSGISERSSTWIAGLSGLFFLSTQEIMDGFSTKWEASTGDEATNILGSALFISQQLVWHKQKIVAKWSYHSTSFPSYRPDLLGSNFAQRMVKDYNGQTFWLSVNLYSFAGRDSRIPKWLNVAVGLGAAGITGPVNTPPSTTESIPYFEKRRLFYIAPDIDLTSIRTHSTALKWLFEAIGFLKFPLPTLEISGKGIKFHPLFF